jgi:hypothetical protein
MDLGGHVELPGGDIGDYRPPHRRGFEDDEEMAELSQEYGLLNGRLYMLPLNFER